MCYIDFPLKSVFFQFSRVFKGVSNFIEMTVVVSVVLIWSCNIIHMYTLVVVGIHTKEIRYNIYMALSLFIQITTFVSPSLQKDMGIRFQCKHVTLMITIFLLLYFLCSNSMIFEKIVSF